MKITRQGREATNEK